MRIGRVALVVTLAASTVGLMPLASAHAVGVRSVDTVLVVRTLGIPAQPAVEVSPARSADDPSELENPSDLENASDYPLPEAVQKAFAPSADPLHGGSNSKPLVTYGTPVRTAYFELDPAARGPITNADLFDLPDRYIAVQYEDGKAIGEYTVDVNGEFIQRGTSTETRVHALEDWPKGAILGTGTSYLFEVQISANGETVAPVDQSAHDALGPDPISADEFRTIVAKKEAAVQAEAKLYNESGSWLGNEFLYNTTFNTIVLVGSAMLLTLGTGVLLVRAGSRRIGKTPKA